ARPERPGQRRNLRQGRAVGGDPTLDGRGVQPRRLPPAPPRAADGSGKGEVPLLLHVRRGDRVRELAPPRGGGREGPGRESRRGRRGSRPGRRVPRRARGNARRGILSGVRGPSPARPPRRGGQRPRRRNTSPYPDPWRFPTRVGPV
ncbi:MAG: DNA polymerase III chi subunit, partial [uncultured Rubrobacteraceae bacterium]